MDSEDLINYELPQETQSVNFGTLEGAAFIGEGTLVEKALDDDKKLWAGANNDSRPQQPTDNKYIDEIFKRLDRLESWDILNRTVDHVNREIGVAQDTPLHERLAQLEATCNATFTKIKEKFNY